MMGLLINRFYIFVFLCFSVSASDYKLEISRYDDDNFIIFLYHNGFSEREFLYKSMCLSGLGGLSFDIKSKHGNKAILKAVINDRCILDRTVTLRSFEVYGRIISYEEITSSYEIKPEIDYVIKVKVCGYEPGDSSCVESNDIYVAF